MCHEAGSTRFLATLDFLPSVGILAAAGPNGAVRWPFFDPSSSPRHGLSSPVSSNCNSTSTIPG